jgi:uncharacterized protein YdcH (DUF465 family)
MFHEHRDIIVRIKKENKHFENIFNKHNELDEEIAQLEKEYAEQFLIESKKKEKLKLKDDIYAMIIKYKQDNAL